MTHDPDHYLTQPMDNQEAALGREIDALRQRMAPTAENIAACAKAIRDLDRITPHPLTAEDQARAVLSFLANAGYQPRRQPLAGDAGSVALQNTPENPKEKT